MHLKKFTGRSARDAIRAVKAELGEEALIMGTKKLTGGAYPVYEVTAAVDFDITGQTGSGPAPEHAPQRERGPSGREEELLKEVAELRDLLWGALGNARGGGARVISEVEREFTERGFSRSFVRKAIAAVAGEGVRDPGVLRKKVTEVISEKIKVADTLSTRSITAFVGPPGVGKTTTIAKLAAIHGLRKKRRTALLSMDTYRIAASEQLRTYGRIMGIPVGVAADASELKRLVREHSDKDLIFIDTAGRTSGSAEQMKALDEIACSVPEAGFNLVLSAQTRQDVLDRTVRAYTNYPVDSLTFTKLDEGRVYGPIFNTMLSSGRPVAYLTTGQRVPEDIYLATEKRLMNLFIPNRGENC